MTSATRTEETAAVVVVALRVRADLMNMCWRPVPQLPLLPRWARSTTERFWSSSAVAEVPNRGVCQPDLAPASPEVTPGLAVLVRLAPISSGTRTPRNGHGRG